jgi:hypothetical protein
MSNSKITRFFLKIGIIDILLAISLLATGCEPFIDVIIENQTHQTLIIFVNDKDVGPIGSGNQTTLKDQAPTIIFRIIAKDMQGNTIFSEKLTPMDMQHLGRNTNERYKVTISTQK